MTSSSLHSTVANGGLVRGVSLASVALRFSPLQRLSREHHIMLEDISVEWLISSSDILMPGSCSFHTAGGSWLRFRVIRY